jgi:hypothetical protein
MESLPMMDLCGEGMALMIQQTYIHPLRIISRISHLSSARLYRQLKRGLRDVSDDAKAYFAQRVIVEFEKNQFCQEGLKDIRTVF